MENQNHITTINYLNYLLSLKLPFSCLGFPTLPYFKVICDKEFHDSEKSQGRVKFFEQNICVIPEKIHASQNKFGL
jgi:hypothetical protein